MHATKKVENLIKKVDTIVHLAAIKKVTELQSSFATLDVNVTSTKIVLNGAKKYKKKLFLHLHLMFMVFQRKFLLKKLKTL